MMHIQWYSYIDDSERGDEMEVTKNKGYEWANGNGSHMNVG